MNFPDTLIYILGREIRTIRTLYWKLSNGKYLWGMQLGTYDRQSSWKPLRPKKIVDWMVDAYEANLQKTIDDETEKWKL